MSRERCESCVGIRKALCDEANRQEVQLVKMMQVMDADDVIAVQGDPSVTAEEISAIHEAAQVESVHLFDYRAAQLSQNLQSLGCVLDPEAVREKLRTRIEG